MKGGLLLAVTVVIVSACIPLIPPFSPDDDGIISVNGRSYQLNWSDEFDYIGLVDPDKWGYETGFVRNDEVQYYTDARPENCWVSNGRLRITAHNDNFEDHEVTSASIETFGLYEFKYGFVQVRAKMPHVGNGSWPAIWTMGVNRPQVGWPSCGEVDIMEWVGRAPNVILGSTFLPDGNGDVTFRSFPYVLLSSQIATNDFHDYAIEWDSEKIRYYMDGVNYVTYYKSDLGPVSWDPLTKEHYLKINLAMGGLIPPIGGGGPINYAGFPYVFEIDYARHYLPI